METRNNSNEAFMEEKRDSESTLKFTSSFLFEKYWIRKLLGLGGSAKVYEAMDTNTNQSVAIKVLTKRTMEESGQTAQVTREIAIMHRMRHHPPRRRFHHDGDLSDKLSANGRFSEDLCRCYFRQLISAVQYCHSFGVFDRDLKLENLLLDQDLNLKLSDFGLCAKIDDVAPDWLLHDSARLVVHKYNK